MIIFKILRIEIENNKQNYLLKIYILSLIKNKFNFRKLINLTCLAKSAILILLIKKIRYLIIILLFNYYIILKI